MQQTWKLRLILALGFLGLAGYILYPSFVYFTLNDDQVRDVRQNKDAFKKYLPSWAPTTRIVPGLDLQGGTNLVLGIDLDKALSDKAGRSTDRLVAFAKDEGVEIKKTRQFGQTATLEDHVELFLADVSKIDEFKTKVLKKFYDFSYVSSTKESVIVKLEEAYVRTLRNEAVDQTVKTIMTRINKMGVTEPQIDRKGDLLAIQLPGLDDPAAAKALIGRTAQLVFQMCNDETTFLKDLKDLPEGVKLVESGYGRPSGGSGRDLYLSFEESKIEEVKTYLANKTPLEVLIAFGQEGRGLAKTAMMRTYALDKKIPLSGDDLVDARVSQGSETDPRPGVSLTFGPTGAKIFTDLTGENIGRRMAIVLENSVNSAPVINQKIPGGSAFISMGGARTNQEMLREANELALVLKAGALPAPVTFREEKSIGPSLGKDSVEQGKMAFLVGILFIAAFMILYYRGSGIIAMIAIVFNMAFILATLALLGATITMPGIAALLLTIGMADDANVIINERIREELRLGKTPASAVKAGYSSAFSAIFDSNVTTFIAGIVLWQFGTGPVQNFATTLMIGTVYSVITAVYVSRIFMDMLTARGQKTLSI